MNNPEVSKTRYVLWLEKKEKINWVKFFINFHSSGKPNFDRSLIKMWTREI